MHTPTIENLMIAHLQTSNLSIYALVFIILEAKLSVVNIALVDSK